MCTVATVRVAEVEVTLPDFAVIVVLASLLPDGRVEVAVANPEVLMVATVALDELQVTVEVTSPVELLPKVPCAENCAVPLVRT